MFPSNTGAGMMHGAQVHNGYVEIAADVRAGAQPEAIVRHFHGTPHEGQEERAVRGIPMLRAAGIGLFAGK
jgi:hypothetical protein